MIEGRQTTRRRFLTDIAALGAAGGLARHARSVETVPSTAGELIALIDTHVYVGDWPHAHIADAEPRALAKLLRTNDVTQAWVGSFDGLFHKDIAAVNERLFNACAGQARGLLVPFGTVNPMLPDWEDDIRRCAEAWKMPGIRLHPNYHGYTLDDPRFAAALASASKNNLLVQLVAALDDQPHKWLSPRTKHVDLKPLPQVAAKVANLRVLVSGTADISETLLGELAKSTSIYFELPQTDAAAIAKVVDRTPAQRIVFGSGAPLHSLASGAGRLNDATVEASVRQIIATKNAMRALNDSN